MCTVCGCGEGEVKLEGHAHPHDHDHGHDHHHEHGHGHHPHGDHETESGVGSRMLRIEQDILGRNNRFAAANRLWFNEHGILSLNLVSSPGSGKTTLLTHSIESLRGTLPMAVIEGDQQTSRDAERIRATGAAAMQINTGKGCHLDAHMVGHALESLKPAAQSLLFIENVGNLVCPAAFDLGESQRVVILSVTEGDDKPLKYPDMFASADLMLLTKIDLLPYVDFDVDGCIAHARRVNPGIKVLQLSARSGEGMEPWLQWLTAMHSAAQAGYLPPSAEG
jgi:hydrogenase nickel incorporation protein HypB